MKMKSKDISILSFLFLVLLRLSALAQSWVTPETALKSYLNNGDNSFKWELKDQFAAGEVTGYNLLVTSQKWRNITWKHQLTILVPKENNFDGALLFVTGGSNKNEEPNWSKQDKMWAPLAKIASDNKAIVALLKQTPNQPLYGDLTEDALISYTLHQFKQDGDYSWPLLFPMVKSAVRAMDAVQQFSKQTLKHDLNRFVISGASKRGWTTWLSGAVDDNRVKAIAPMVIDVLNMPVNLEYQLTTYGTYSEQIDDYVKLGIPQSAKTEQGRAINTMIDPYSYRAKLTMPKLIFMGTNDEYWTIDAIKHYYDDIPGKNMIHYVPNAGHDLGGGKQAFEALSAFFGTTLQNKNYPVATWKTASGKNGITLDIKADKKDLVEVLVWSANSTDRDFRNETWTSQSLGAGNNAPLQIEQAYPENGYRAFYVDLKYKSPAGGTYTVSTRAFLTDPKKVI
ncbi:PhoPQ-activated pathogenicity-related family protein [Telluribacter sp.]|jgi:PhoPQ-activated pathogenicity-related protein|uniref:PhoPQ-activated pathogenicity-related family protein n=1 Tax=Telluribacter sp. TaxID=1978767 RepID=UPI002E0E91A5|nr:PhoPQ-activated protein PqaA family protein [Telluribacter sp.]